MKVIDLINNSKSPLFTFELVPPLKGNNADKIFSAIDRLVDLSPAYINITFHTQETVYSKQENGSFKQQIVRKRPGTLALSAAVKYKYNIPVVPHLICQGHSAEDLENILIDLNFLGLENVLALRGDPPKGTRVFTAEKDGHQYTTQLIEQISNLNKGKYLDPNLKNTSATNFCTGAAGYPEKHIESPNMDMDIQHLKEKVDAGAEYIVTQMFFINDKYFDFVKRCREAGITVPIIPGIKPVSTMRDIDMLAQTFAIDLPADLVKDIKNCKSNDEARQVGVDFCIEQSRGLLKGDIPGIHYYTLGRSDNVRQIVKTVF